MSQPSQRNLRTRATLLRDDEKTVVVEDSFPVKEGLAEGEAGKVDAGSSGDVTPGALERWAIKIEHSINIALTVSGFP
ncbi:hypothetical protein QJS10_CPA10g01933 [Acorus calamus]|uniref:Uncharacterized protein n=1 Tax=Acorus calamus TaxID=4465 RepID=A0AAV9DYT2_ACOCL|nr:hypothetical protein QJS10_CPA10g01933 [Acorus calamus]